MKTLLVIVSLVLLAVLLPAQALAWSPGDGYQEWSDYGYTFQYPKEWVGGPFPPFLLRAADPSGFPYLVASVDAKGRSSTYLDLANKMGADNPTVLNNIGFVTLPSGFKVKEGKINFVYQGSTYFATVLCSDEKNMYFSCMVVFPWDQYNQIFAQDIFNTVHKSTAVKKNNAR